MPKIEITEVLPDHIFFVPKGEEPPKRSSGYHLSGIIQNLYYVHIKKLAAQNIDEAAAIVEAGFSWESLLEQAWAYREGQRMSAIEGVTRPGELFYDGVYMTPDGHRPEKGEIHEYKLTTRSAAKLKYFEDEFINYIWQAAAYCLAMGYKKVVFKIMCIGRSQLNKEDKWKPARVFEVVCFFTDSELRYHWSTIKRHLEWMIMNGYKGEQYGPEQ